MWPVMLVPKKKILVILAKENQIKEDSEGMATLIAAITDESTSFWDAFGPFIPFSVLFICYLTLFYITYLPVLTIIPLLLYSLVRYPLDFCVKCLTLPSKVTPILTHPRPFSVFFISSASRHF